MNTTTDGETKVETGEAKVEPGEAKVKSEDVKVESEEAAKATEGGVKDEDDGNVEGWYDRWEFFLDTLSFSELHHPPYPALFYNFICSSVLFCENTLVLTIIISLVTAASFD